MRRRSRNQAVRFARNSPSSVQTGPDSELMTPGSLLLGNPGPHFERGHAHGAGDRCLSFRYAPDYFARLAADAGARDSTSRFRVLRLPPVRALSPVIALSCAGLAGSTARSWEELSVQVAVHTLQTAGGLARNTRDASANAVARVTRIFRLKPEATGCVTRLHSRRDD